MSIDLPPPLPAYTITIGCADIVIATSAYYCYPTRREAVPAEKRAAIRQQEGMMRARATWGRHEGETRGFSRRERPERLERGYGPSSHSARAWERKRKAVMATFR